MGFQIFDTTTDNHTVYVKTESNSVFSNHIKAQMKELIKVDQYGKRVNMIIPENGGSPEFIKLFFNFL